MPAVGSFASLRMTLWCRLDPSPNGARRISLESRIQAAVGDTYHVLKELGGGGMSRVFLAEEARLSRQVVIKVLQPAVREVRTRLAQLAREPGG